MLSTRIILALLTLVPATLAGSAVLVNNCGTPVYYASVKNDNNAQMRPLAPGARYTERFAVASNGVSIKISPSIAGKVTQFEFTLGDNGQLFYDTSNIDGNPFAWTGTRLAPSIQASSAFPTCVTIDCPPGQTCHAAYNQPNDVRTKVCPGNVDLVFTLCTGNQNSQPANAYGTPAAPQQEPVHGWGDEAWSETGEADAEGEIAEVAEEEHEDCGAE